VMPAIEELVSELEMNNWEVPNGRLPR